MAPTPRTCHASQCRDQDLENRLRRYFGSDVTQSHLKMAEAPDGDPFCLECIADYALPIAQGRQLRLIPHDTHSGSAKAESSLRKDTYVIPGGAQHSSLVQHAVLSTPSIDRLGNRFKDCSSYHVWSYAHAQHA